MTNLYCILDTCSGVFGDPVVADNDAVAKRVFEYAVSDPSIPDYIRQDSVLYRIATFDRASGEVCPVVPCVVLRGCNVQPRSIEEATENEE